MINEGIPAIDAWCNPFTELGIKAIFTENPEVAFMMGDQWGRHDNMKWHTVDEFVAYMDENNVRRVCTPALKMMQYRTRQMLSDIPNEHIYEQVAAHPDRIVGLAGINPISGMEGVRALERAVVDYGFKGAHVHPFGFGIPINEREWWPFYAKCAELDVPVIFQVGHSAEFMPSAIGKPILLDDIAIWFPELRPDRRTYRLAVDRGADRDGVEASQRLHRRLRPRAEILGPEASCSSSMRAGAASARSCTGPTIR